MPEEPVVPPPGSPGLLPAGMAGVAGMDPRFLGVGNPTPSWMPQASGIWNMAPNYMPRGGWE
jgi:hypothetical protein